MILPAHGRNPLNFRPQHVLARAIQAGPIFDQLLDKAVYLSAAGWVLTGKAGYADAVPTVLSEINTPVTKNTVPILAEPISLKTP